MHVKTTWTQPDDKCIKDFILNTSFFCLFSSWQYWVLLDYSQNNIVLKKHLINISAMSMPPTTCNALNCYLSWWKKRVSVMWGMSLTYHRSVQKNEELCCYFLPKFLLHLKKGGSLDINEILSNIFVYVGLFIYTGYNSENYNKLSNEKKKKGGFTCIA